MSQKKDSSKTPAGGDRTKRRRSTQTGGAASLPIPSLLQILVACESEGQQQELFERLRGEGYKCRVLTL